MAFEADAGSVEVAGPVKVFTSSEWAERAFCATCGSALWYRITAPGLMHGQYQIAAGLFDNAGGMAPRLEVYIDKKPAGYALEGGDARRQMTEAEVIEAFAPKE
ncbi:GFA family protein [Marimonas arenosa]|uniref:GFA family protein n=2 Tax=Marimonas arenosa TaxID=1795305 RepID=A0AAE4B4J8_9RHOB|nr:GFA family protein [Marimonas arenosa]